MKTEIVTKKTLFDNRKFGNMVLIVFALILLFALEMFFKMFTYFGIELYWDNLTVYVAYVGSVLSVMLTFVVYMHLTSWKRWMSMRKFFAVAVSLLIGYSINLVIEEVSIYYIPFTFVAFILVSLVDRRDVFICNLVVNLLTYITIFFERQITGVTYDQLDSLLLFVLGLLMGALATYYLTGATSRLTFFVRSLIIGLINMEFMFVVSLLCDMFDFVHSLGILSVVNFGQIIIAIVLQPVFESLFGILTNAKLREITDHEAPLLKRLINEAPGTFNHCLSVASFAEVCAMAIGENVLLTKACAYYHDMGKLSSPMYFSENQNREVNPHDNLLPEVSADILRKHTTYGYELCKQNNIPEEISTITIEHHGTLPMAVFYNKAKQLTDSDVDLDDYRYHGQLPTTKIAAIIMICDASEAAIRSMGKPSAEQVDKLLTGIISERIELHQFDDCDITMSDLNTIRETIKSAYGGIVHSRVQYPQGDVRK